VIDTIRTASKGGRVYVHCRLSRLTSRVSSLVGSPSLKNEDGAWSREHHEVFRCAAEIREPCVAPVLEAVELTLKLDGAVDNDKSGTAEDDEFPVLSHRSSTHLGGIERQGLRPVDLPQLRLVTGDRQQQAILSDHVPPTARRLGDSDERGALRTSEIPGAQPA